MQPASFCMCYTGVVLLRTQPTLSGALAYAQEMSHCNKGLDYSTFFLIIFFARLTRVFERKAGTSVLRKLYYLWDGNPTQGDSLGSHEMSQT